MSKEYTHTITLRPPTDEQYAKLMKPIFSGKLVCIDRETGNVYDSLETASLAILTEIIEDESKEV